MNDLRTTARAAVARLSSVIEARAHNPSSINVRLDVAEPLVAVFDLLSDELDALKLQIAELQQAR